PLAGRWNVCPGGEPAEQVAGDHPAPRRLPQHFNVPPQAGDRGAVGLEERRAGRAAAEAFEAHAAGAGEAVVDARVGQARGEDVVVYSRNGPNPLVDVKGRQLRNRAERKGFETWATEQDVNDLAQWEQVFGQGYKAVFTFVYWIDPPLHPEPGMFAYRGRWY